MNQYFSKDFLLKNKQLVIKVAVIFFIFTVAFFVFVLGENKEAAHEPEVTQTQKAVAAEPTETAVKSIMVDVGGAVKTPQVVELKEESRVADAISAAGGLKENADTAEINQAAFLTDGQKIYIPAKGEKIPAEVISAENSTQPGAENPGMAGGKVNLNTATSEELQTLNGVGPATAEKILEYRSSNGYFKNIEEIKNVNGIGDKTFEKLKEHIMV